jgi:tetratricopeptide (TPR) repeat protein
MKSSDMKKFSLLTAWLLLFFFSQAQMKGLKDGVRGVLSSSESIDYEKLIDIFNDMIKQFPDKPSGYNNLGAVKYKMQDYAGALENLNKAVELSPYYPDALFNRGLVRFAKSDFKGAAADFKAASAISSRDPHVY